jgi:FemAB-related protein (PEP-CTERM system-associated)
MECKFVRSLDPRWDEFVLAQPQGTFFHLLAWREIIASKFGFEPMYLCVQESGLLRGVLPLFLVKSLIFGRSLVAMPMGVYGGIVASDPIAGRLLVEEATRLACELQVRYLELRGNPYGAFDVMSHANGTASSWYRKDLYVTFLGPIDPDNEVNLARIPRKQRRMIRQGEKHGLKATFDNNRLREFYDVYAESVRNLGTPVYGYAYFRSLLDTFGDRCKVLVIEHQQKVIAGVMAFFYRDQVLPYYGGAVKEWLHLAPNDFMYWQLMCFAASRGCKSFDFGRSKEGTGSFHFKRHWGFDAKPLPYWCYSPSGQAIPDTSPLNPKIQWAIRIWRGLPLPVTKSLGPHIVRHIP